jgi:hypothetical protein
MLNIYLFFYELNKLCKYIYNILIFIILKILTIFEKYNINVISIIYIFIILYNIDIYINNKVFLQIYI